MLGRVGNVIVVPIVMKEANQKQIAYQTFVELERVNIETCCVAFSGHTWQHRCVEVYFKNSPCV